MKSKFGLFRYILGIAGAVGMIMALVVQDPAPAALADKYPNPGVLPPQSKPYGMSYGQWSEAWWQWVFRVPVPQANREAHPLFDTTGVNCGVGQEGPVWFLGGGFGPSTIVRNCTMPAGKAIFFPILNSERDNAQGRYARTVEDMRLSAITRQDAVADLAAELDGEAITNIADYRISTLDTPMPFGFTVPEENLLNRNGGYPVPAGSCYVPIGLTECVPYVAVNDGYYLMLAPLSPGEHVLHFSGTLLPTFHLDVTYYLTVEP
jgi:hypothetical protein